MMSKAMQQGPYNMGKGNFMQHWGNNNNNNNMWNNGYNMNFGGGMMKGSYGNKGYGKANRWGGKSSGDLHNLMEHAPDSHEEHNDCGDEDSWPMAMWSLHEMEDEKADDDNVTFQELGHIPEEFVTLDRKLSSALISRRWFNRCHVTLIIFLVLSTRRGVIKEVFGPMS